MPLARNLFPNRLPLITRSRWRNGIGSGAGAPLAPRWTYDRSPPISVDIAQIAMSAFGKAIEASDRPRLAHTGSSIAGIRLYGAVKAAAQR